MNKRDLCNNKKFPDLEDDFNIIVDRKKRLSFIDEKNNIWLEGKKISEGGHGKVIEFISHNKDYSDLAVKFFIAEEEDEYLLDMQEETDIVNFFNLHKCKNFLNMGVKDIHGDKIIIMEKIDGDILNFNFENYDYPIKIFEKMVMFIVSGFRCALRKDKYYMDIKEENIGFKLCKNGPVFTLLDFGSFFDKNSTNPVSSYYINRYANNNNFFSNEMVFVFGTIITLLSARLSIRSKLNSKTFSDFISNLSEEKKYQDTNLLEKNYYYRIKKFFLELFNEKDEFVDILFECLNDLTILDPDVYVFLKRIDYYS